MVVGPTWQKSRASDRDRLPESGPPIIGAVEHERKLSPLRDNEFSRLATS